MSILGHALQLNLDACILSISWKVVICGGDNTSADRFWDDVRAPENCRPLDKALNIYLNEYVRVLQVVVSVSAFVCYLHTGCSPSDPILSFDPLNTELISKRLE